MSRHLLEAQLSRVIHLAGWLAGRPAGKKRVSPKGQTNGISMRGEKAQQQTQASAGWLDIIILLKRGRGLAGWSASWLAGPEEPNALCEPVESCSCHCHCRTLLAPVAHYITSVCQPFGPTARHWSRNLPTSLDRAMKIDGHCVCSERRLLACSLSPLLFPFLSLHLVRQRA